MTGAILNNTRPDTVRRPRYQVLANGTVLMDSTRVSITNQNNYSADRCTITLITEPSSKTGFAWWEGQDTVTIEVRVGFLPDGAREDAQQNWPAIFKGRVDSYELHYETNIIEIEARDFSAGLADTKTAETFANRTASEIATILAGRHGLMADVQPTSTAVGVYYQAEHDKIVLGSFHRETTEWKLLVYLAQQEGYDVWVTGDTLHFRQAAREDDTPYVVLCRYREPGIWVSNTLDLRLHRDLTKSKDIKVEVKSWNAKQKTAHVYSAGGGSSGTAGKTGGKGAAGSSPTVYTYVLPGLTAAQAQDEANKRLAYLTKLERRISYSEPGTLDYNVRSLIKLSGTPSDGTYYIDQMTRDLSFEQGFVQHVQAKNHSSKGSVNVG